MAGSGAGQRQGFSAGGQSGMSGTLLLGGCPAGGEAGSRRKFLPGV